MKEVAKERKWKKWNENNDNMKNEIMIMKEITNNEEKQ